MAQADELKGMTIEQIRAHRAKFDEEIAKRERELREQAEQQILALAASHDIDLSKLARESSIYRNPDDPWETWSGRGRKPRWVQKWLGAGRALSELESKNVEKRSAASGHVSGGPDSAPSRPDSPGGVRSAAGGDVDDAKRAAGDPGNAARAG